jgi:hypothetical protein
MVKSGIGLVPLVIWWFGVLGGASGQSLPRDLKAWTLDYGISGGIAGIVRHVTLTADGSVVVDDGKGGTRLTGRAPDDLMTKMAALLTAARDERQPEKRRPMPDQIHAALSLTTAGHEHRLQLTPAISALIDDIVDKTGKRAVVGTWWQSGWKLCVPAARLAPSDVDPPIEALVLNTDGTFSVTWKGGGAHTTDVPHVPIPDYSGRYDIFPVSGLIGMRIESGIFTPADFSGQGSFTVSPNELTLRKVWFGTKHAARTPNICELTFKKK